MDAHHEDIRSHVAVYYKVFAALLVLTVVTVSVSYLHLATREAIVVALAIAGLKASLVALFFMHLSNERKLIYYALLLTAVFFLFLMIIPLATNLDKIVLKYV
jgi:cytochrome c oxidase subunit IV